MGNAEPGGRGRAEGGGEGRQQHVRAGEVTVGNGALFHVRQHLGQLARQGEDLARIERALREQHLLPGWAFDPGHQDSIDEVWVLLEQSSVVRWGEHGALGGAQTGQVGEGGQLLGLGDEGRRAKARLKDLQGDAPLTPNLSPGGSGDRGEGIDDPRPPFLAVGEARSSRVLGDAVDSTGDDQFILNVRAKGHGLIQHRVNRGNQRRHGEQSSRR